MDYKNQIDDFILGKLSLTEKENFQQQLLVDSDLAQQVKKREIMLAGLEALGNQKMKDRIKAVQQEIREEENSISLKKRKNERTLLWISTVAALFVIGVVGWQFFAPAEINAEKIFAETYHPYLKDFGSRGAETSKEYLQAGSFYNNKNYKAAIPLLQNILEKEPQNSKVELLLGDCFLSIDEPEKTIAHCKAVLERKSNLYKDPAYWFLALSYLKQNKIEKCKETLTTLIEDRQADYHKEAKALIFKLD